MWEEGIVEAIVEDAKSKSRTSKSREKKKTSVTMQSFDKKDIVYFVFDVDEEAKKTKRSTKSSKRNEEKEIVEYVDEPVNSKRLTEQPKQQVRQ